MIQKALKMSIKTCLRNQSDYCYLPKTKFNSLISSLFVKGFSNQVAGTKKEKRNDLTSEIPSKNCDWVGPPDKLSNLTTYKYHISEEETPLETNYRLKRKETEDWNHAFWSEHNCKFKKEKASFIEKKLIEKYGKTPPTGEPRNLSADEIAEFYKSFLKTNYKSHSNYNKEWYKRNFNNLALELRVSLQRIFKKFQFKVKSN